jgi:hypothetical protein
MKQENLAKDKPARGIAGATASEHSPQFRGFTTKKMSLYLQLDGYGGSLLWMLGALIVLVITFLLTRKAQKDQRSHQQELKDNDPYQKVVNDSSYNINREGIDGHRDENLSAEEARRAVDDLEQTEQLPSEEEFNELRKDMKDKK